VAADVIGHTTPARVRVQVKVWYGDGVKVASPDLRDPAANLTAWWHDLRTTDVQVVAIVYAETYPIMKQDGYDESGRPINQRRELEHYVDLLRGKDYYWYDPATDTFGGADLTRDIPDGVLVVRAQAMTDADWFALYNTAKEDRRVE
jgi:hypothetical protein